MSRKLIVLLADFLSVAISYGFALLLRFDCRMNTIPKEYMEGYLYFLPVICVMTWLVYSLFRLYKSVWSYVGESEFLRTFAASIISVICAVCIANVFLIRMPVSIYLVGWGLQFGLTAGIRLFYRFLRRVANDGFRFYGKVENVMIIGAGAAGNTLLREFTHSQKVKARVRCIIDDNPTKEGRYLGNVPIVGGRDMIVKAAEKYRIQRIILAIPTLTATQKKEILNICQQTDCEVQTVPGIYQLINGEVSIAQLRPVDVEDLLGREPIKTELEEILFYVQDRTVLVTGGGGSIGSELCRQLAAHKVRHLIIFDIYENNAYDIQQELKDKYPDMKLTVLIGSVRDKHRLETIFEQYQPEIVYHAAAHKHVPLMEDSPNETIKNNVMGTYNTAECALKYNVRRFVLISTDKAVNPTNVMGASKRLCEMVLQMFADKVAAGQGQTVYAAVRFGNVLGSNGSVIPLFKRQIAKGGPVTVTHPDIIRYFMTIPEAVSLVLQVGAYAMGGEVFVLDMGEPVKIADLAERLIRFSGYTPNVDIKIEYTGLRPGEKLYEELLIGKKGLRSTQNQKIFVETPPPVNSDLLIQQLDELQQQASNECSNMKELMKKVVPEYRERTESLAS